MDEPQLCYGIMCSASFQELLKEVPERIFNFIVQDHPDYLQKMTHGGKEFLGRNLGLETNLSALELIHHSLESLVRRLIPDYSSEEFPFVLVALINEPSSQ